MEDPYQKRIMPTNALTHKKRESEIVASNGLDAPDHSDYARQ